MTMRDALERAMGHSPDEGTVRQLQQGGLAVVSEDTVSQAIHDVYCGIVADHQHPNEKDREQAKALIASLNKQLAEAVATGGAG
jgi:hypothetical protein